MPDPTPTLTREELLKVEYDYLTGNYKSIAELARKYKVKEVTLYARIKREQWDLKRESIVKESDKKIEKGVINEAELWLKRVKERSLKDWSIIDQSIDGLVQSTGGVEPADLRNYIAARKLLDDMHRRALGLLDAPQSLDITSKGQSLGESLLSAIAKLRQDQSVPKITSEEVDQIIEAEIIDEPPKP